MLQFKNNDIKNHILNEKNKLITNDFINNLLKKYNCNHQVKNLDLFQLAMIHISYLEKTSYTEKTQKMLLETIPIDDNIDLNNVIKLQTESYGRLEFYGDSVIKKILSKYLFQRYALENEGFLTQIRTKIEKSSTLSQLSIHLGLHEYAIIARNIEQANGRLTNIHLTEDIFEAFIGALELDSDIYKTETFIINIIENCINLSEMIDNNDNYKEQLNQYFQKQKWGDPKYICESSKSVFKISISVPNSNVIGYGVDKIKIDAEQLCAKDVLEKLNIINNNDVTDFFGECI